MALFVKSGDKFDYSFLRDEGVRYGNRGKLLFPALFLAKVYSVG